MENWLKWLIVIIIIIVILIVITIVIILVKKHKKESFRRMSGKENFLRTNSSDAFNEFVNQYIEAEMGNWQ